MLYELTEIKRLRNKLGLNQKELANLANVSQSLVAKIEAGKIEPTYNKVKKIFEILNSLREKEEVKAKKLMNKKIIFVRPKEKIKEIIKIMKQKGISQIPVSRKGKVCGIIAEKTILEKIAEGKPVGGMEAEEIMADCPPIVSLGTSQRVVLGILKEHPIVLVAENGDVKGLISKSDVLDRI